MAACALAWFSSAAEAQDFDPHGRGHAHPPPRHPGPAPTGVRTPAGAPPGAGTPAGPSQAALIDRYTHVVLSQPGAAFPLQRLAQLYRDRDGSVSALVQALQAIADKPGPEQYAAMVGLAGLYKLDGHAEEAIAAYEKAIAKNGADAGAVLALAGLLEDRGDGPQARARYEQALALETAKADKEQTLRTLIALALDEKDWAGAKGFHRSLMALEPTSLFVRGELARALIARGEYTRAEVELKDVVAAAAGDNRALAPALKELGAAQAKAHESADALATLKRALAAAGPESALRAEIYELIASLYRADQKLPVLIGELTAEHPNDIPRLTLLGGLYEETGDGAKAIETYRRALALNPRQIDLHLRLIRLLQSNGELDRAIAEYEALVRQAPDNPQFAFEECEALLQRGDHARALALVTALEARAANDEEILSRVADFYARIGENERSLRVLQRLAATGAGGDAGHLVDLGDRYFQDGNVPLALATWKRIPSVVSPRAKAMSALGDVYLEHDLANDAVAAYKEAVALEPANLGYQKALAAAFERTRAYREAREIYEGIVKKATAAGDRSLARECRTRIVTLWGLEHVLEQKVPGLRRAFDATPPDVEAGRTLAEALLHLRRPAEADVALRKVIALAPGDVDSYLALERVFVQEGRIADAIALLEKLAEIEPKRARELYQRMAQYALQIYKDDDAIKYAVRAVELNPDDAEGHRRLGEMYRSKQDTDHAISEFRAAIAKNDRLFVVYFELADLYLSKGQAEEADRLFRAVVRGAPDEELVARAARLSTQINLSKGTLESLEQDLLPLAIGNPGRPIYRRLLVEIYGSLTFGLAARVRHGTPTEADEARAALSRIGARAVKPLLDALADPDVSQQRIAIDVLAYVQNPNAALPLFTFASTATGADVAQRARAMLACGALANGSLVPKYEALLFPKDENSARPEVEGPIGVAAVWGLARMSDAAGRERALPLLRQIAAKGTPAMQALAVLGLGFAHDTASAGAIAEMARAVDASTQARAAAARALGDLGATSAVPELVEIAEDGEALPRRMALLSLARMAAAGKDPSWKHEAVQAMSDSLFPAEAEVARGHALAQSVAATAASALAILAARTRGASDSDGRARARDLMPVPDVSLDVDALLDATATGHESADERRAALVAFAEPIQRAALAALGTSGERARAVLDALGSGEGELLPFVARGETGPAADAASAIGRAMEPNLLPLARHPDPEIRTKALVLLARSPREDATQAVVAGLEDPSEAVQRVALSAVASPRPDAKGGASADSHAAAATEAVGRILQKSDSWAMRVLAAQALGRLGAADGAAAGPLLARAAGEDRYALVRQAALVSLASFDTARARAVAETLVTTDPEPRVRETAKSLTR
jgi:tetratricopeptide (TPR) repeat protein